MPLSVQEACMLTYSVTHVRTTQTPPVARRATMGAPGRRWEVRVGGRAANRRKETTTRRPYRRCEATKQEKYAIPIEGRAGGKLKICRAIRTLAEGVHLPPPPSVLEP